MTVKKPELINVNGALLELARPLIMGVINVTPDSFYGLSRHQDECAVIEKVSKMVLEGADIIDVGGYSTRPGASIVTEEDEKARVLRILKEIRREFPDLVISLDTYRASVAREARYEAGIDIINDISGGNMDSSMIQTVSELDIPYIMVHMQGTPDTMQVQPAYDDVVSDIIGWFGKRIPTMLQQGMKDIIIDPGIGFGKTIEQNYQILNRLSEFSVIGLPVLVGVSRKTLIWKTLGVSPADALTGTTALNMAALMNGADILRVHDVLDAVQTAMLYEKLKGEGN